MGVLKKLLCKHDFMTPVAATEWEPTFLTTNDARIDEDERQVIFRCDDCNKRVTRMQAKSHGSIVTLKGVPEDLPHAY
jgi:hypothetical protein